MTENELRVEFLVIVDTNNSFCANEDAFNNLLRTNSEISIENGKLKYKNLEVDYKVQTKELETQEKSNYKKRFFHIHLIRKEISNIDYFEDLLRVVRELLHKAGKPVQTLWDDVSFYYSRKAYPLIYEIENLMRKLITKFMLTNVGIGWTKRNIPEEVKKSVRYSITEDSDDYLYKTDFIQLANFLFINYSPLPVTNLMEKLKRTNNINELSLNDLKNFVPKSNWERYFSNLVDCEAEYLHKRWKKLYEFRNRIAHNNHIIKKDYEDIVKTVWEVKDKLERAISSLDKIHIPIQDKEIVAENIARRKNHAISDFLNEYNKMITIINFLGESDEIRPPGLSSFIRQVISGSTKLIQLKRQEIIDEKTYEEITNIQDLRNIIVHSNEYELSLDQEGIEKWTKRCKELNENLLKVSRNYVKKMEHKDSSSLIQKT